MRASSLARAAFLLHLAAASVAVGGSVVFAAAVAPAAFRVLPSRALAGDLTGAVLSTLCGILEGCFAALFATTWILTRDDPKSRLSVVVRRLPVLGFFSALTTAALIVPAAERLRRSLPSGADLSAADAAVRSRFARLHSLSVWLLVLEFACALSLLALAARFFEPREKQNPDVPRVPQLPVP
jgi:hypothetical protein